MSALNETAVTTDWNQERRGGEADREGGVCWTQGSVWSRGVIVVLVSGGVTAGTGGRSVEWWRLLVLQVTKRLIAPRNIDSVGYSVAGEGRCFHFILDLEA